MTRKTLTSTIVMIGVLIGGAGAFLSLPLSTDRVPPVLAQTAASGEHAPEGGGITSRALPAQELIFLRIGNIRGTATTKGFEQSLVLNDFSYQISQRGEWEEGNRLSGRLTTFGDITFEKYADWASPFIAQSCANKDQFPKAELALFDGRGVYMKVTLEGVIVTSVKLDFDPATLRPKETFTLSYKKATWEWGTAKAGYDLRSNTKV